MPDHDKTTGPAPQLAVEIDRNTVTLIIECKDRYAAIELYESVCAGGREGYIELELETANGR